MRKRITEQYFLLFRMTIEVEMLLNEKIKKSFVYRMTIDTMMRRRWNHEKKNLVVLMLLFVYAYMCVELFIVGVSNFVDRSSFGLVFTISI